MKLFVDMDGVTADFMGRFLPLVKEKLGETLTVPGITSWAHLDKPEYTALMDTPGLFRHLAPIPGCQQVLDLLSEQHDVYILSAAHPANFRDKHEWVCEYLPFIDPRHILFSRVKGEVAGPGKVLIDDGPHNLNDWRDAGGIAICYDQPWNQEWDGLRIRDWFDLPHVLHAIHKRQVVFLSLSGSGKSTTQSMLVKTNAFRQGVTCATRSPRGHERDGWDHDFITVDEYVAACHSGRMSERTEYRGTGKPYGILRHRVEEAEQSPLPTVWVLDSTGLRWMQDRFGAENVVGVFLCTDKETLRWRMTQRGDQPLDITRRLAAYDAEVTEGMTLGQIVIDVRRLNPLQVRDAVLKRLAEV